MPREEFSFRTILVAVDVHQIWPISFAIVYPIRSQCTNPLESSPHSHEPDTELLADSRNHLFSCQPLHSTLSLICRQIRKVKIKKVNRKKMSMLPYLRFCCATLGTKFLTRDGELVNPSVDVAWFVVQLPASLYICIFCRFM